MAVGTAAAGPKNFAQWLRFALSAPDKFKDDGSPASCVALSLMHLNGQAEKEIHSIPIGNRKYDEPGIVELANLLQGIAATDAQNLTGRQSYVVYAFYDNDTTKHGARFPLQINGHIVNQSGDFSTESPTAEGRLQQRMRHDEAYSQMLITANANIINLQNQFMRLQAERLTESMRESTGMFTMVREMLLEKVAADREHEMKVLEYERNSKLMEAAAKFAPAMLNTITGKEIVPQSTVDTGILEALADVVDEKMMATLMPLLSKLPPATAGVVMSRLEEIQKAKIAGEERLKKHLETSNTKTMAMAELGESNESTH